MADSNLPDSSPLNVPGSSAGALAGGGGVMAEDDGMPSLNPTGENPVSSAAVDPSGSSSTQSWYSSIESGVSGVVAGVENVASKTVSAAVSGIETGYGAAKSAAGTVLSDVESGTTSAINTALAPAKSVFLYLLLGVAVVGAVIYYAGKSGALKVNAIV
jgi:hypothetical protein